VVINWGVFFSLSISPTFDLLQNCLMFDSNCEIMASICCYESEMKGKWRERERERPRNIEVGKQEEREKTKDWWSCLVGLKGGFCLINHIMICIIQNTPLEEKVKHAWHVLLLKQRIPFKRERERERDNNSMKMQIIECKSYIIANSLLTTLTFFNHNHKEREKTSESRKHAER